MSRATACSNTPSPHGVQQSPGNRTRNGAGIEQNNTPGRVQQRRQATPPAQNRAPPERRPEGRLCASSSRILQQAVPHAGRPHLRVRTPFHSHPAEHAYRETPTPERAQRDAANGVQQTTVGRRSNPAPNPRIQRNARTTATARTRNASSSRTRTFEYVPTTNRPRRRTDTRAAHARQAAHRRAPRTDASPGNGNGIEQYATPAGIERRRAPADHTDYTSSDAAALPHARGSPDPTRADPDRLDPTNSFTARSPPSARKRITLHRGTPYPVDAHPRPNHPFGEPTCRCASRPNGDRAWGTKLQDSRTPHGSRSPPSASTAARSRAPESHARGPRATTKNATSKTPSQPGRARATAAWRRPV